MSDLISVEVITSKIFFLRGKKVMLDSDLALLYGVRTKRLNEQVKRNKKRFPEDFMFQLTPKEKEEVSNIIIDIYWYEFHTMGIEEAGKEFLRLFKVEK